MKRHDAGLTLVEVLVALVLTSLLVVAIGWLFSFSITLHDRTASAEATFQSLLNIKAFSAVIGHTAATQANQRLEEPSTSGFRLVLADDAQTGLTIDLLPRTDQSALTLHVAFSKASVGESSSVDLGGFDAARIDYVVVSAQTIQLVTARDIGTASAVAARLVLTQGGRQWATILWTAARRP